MVAKFLDEWIHGILPVYLLCPLLCNQIGNRGSRIHVSVYWIYIHDGVFIFPLNRWFLIFIRFLSDRTQVWSPWLYRVHVTHNNNHVFFRNHWIFRLLLVYPKNLQRGKSGLRRTSKDRIFIGLSFLIYLQKVSSYEYVRQIHVISKIGMYYLLKMVYVHRTLLSSKPMIGLRPYPK